MDSQVTRRTPFAALPDLLRVEEVAAYLGVSKGVVYDEITRGHLPAIRIGRLLRVPRDGVRDRTATRDVA